MADLIYITDQDVFLRFGGQQYLAQALGNGFAGIDQDRLLLAKRDACEKIAAACQVQIDVQAAFKAGNIPQFMVTLAAQECVYLCWLYGTTGQACPDFVKAQHDEVDRELERIRTRQRSIGSPEKYPASSQLLEKSNYDPTRTRMTVRNFGGPNGLR